MKQSKLLFSKKLRSNQTDSEKLMWNHLRNRKFMGIKFRRQQLIGNYIVDFVCLEQKLVIELDGEEHSKKLKQLRDDIRTNWLTNEGFLVLRFWNQDVIRNIEETLEEVRQIFVRRFGQAHPHSDSLPSREKESKD